MSLKVAYVDDELGLCQSFEDNFASDDLLITTFTDPEKALTVINTGEFDLVLLDFRLPNITGDEIAARIKVKVPVALITGDLNVKPSAKFVKIFSKPCSFDEMTAFLQSFNLNYAREFVAKP